MTQSPPMREKSTKALGWNHSHRRSYRVRLKETSAKREQSFQTRTDKQTNDQPSDPRASLLLSSVRRQSFAIKDKSGQKDENTERQKDKTQDSEGFHPNFNELRCTIKD